MTTKDEALKLASALDDWATQMDMGRKPDPKSLTRKASAELRRLQAELDTIRQTLAEPTVRELAEYDAGLLNDYGGGNVEWWQDYIRSELSRAYDYYQSQL
jgi:hypothetical protein